MLVPSPVIFAVEPLTTETPVPEIVLHVTLNAPEQLLTTVQFLSQAGKIHVTNLALLDFDGEVKKA
jgi:hypothetical protein